ncbi:hypothetical protein [Edaphobacillus lindanitolerans]|nr:hypothetical protein [Edaphobacillus lindanitolerans]
MPTTIGGHLGDEDVAPTLDIYTHLYLSVEKEAVLGIENGFQTA